MDTTLALLLTVLACTFIGMIAAIIAATNRPNPTGTQKPVPKTLQAKPVTKDAVLPVEWRDMPVIEAPRDTVQYRGVVVVTRHVDVKYQLR